MYLNHTHIQLLDLFVFTVVVHFHLEQEKKTNTKFWFSDYAIRRLTPNRRFYKLIFSDTIRSNLRIAVQYKFLLIQCLMI